MTVRMELPKPPDESATLDVLSEAVSPVALGEMLVVRCTVPTKPLMLDSETVEFWLVPFTKL